MGKSKGEFFVNIDVEAFGPCPGIHSMVQLGAVLTDASGAVLGEFSRNLEEVEGTVRDKLTMAWWDEQEIKFPGLMRSLKQDRVHPEIAMYEFTALIEETEKATKCKAVVAAYPAGFDFHWLVYYLHKFTGRSCVGFSCLDIKTLSMAVLNRGYRDHGKKDMPKHWFSPDLPHTHNALQDSFEQSAIMHAALKDMAKLHERARLVDVLEAKLTDAEHRAWESDKDWS